MSTQALGKHFPILPPLYRVQMLGWASSHSLAQVWSLPVPCPAHRAVGAAHDYAHRAAGAAHDYQPSSRVRAAWLSELRNAKWVYILLQKHDYHMKAASSTKCCTLYQKNIILALMLLSALVCLFLKCFEICEVSFYRLHQNTPFSTGFSN